MNWSSTNELNFCACVRLRELFSHSKHYSSSEIWLSYSLSCQINYFVFLSKMFGTTFSKYKKSIHINTPFNFAAHLKSSVCLHRTAASPIGHVPHRHWRNQIQPKKSRDDHQPAPVRAHAKCLCNNVFLSFWMNAISAQFTTLSLFLSLIWLCDWLSVMTRTVMTVRAKLTRRRLASACGSKLGCGGVFSTQIKIAWVENSMIAISLEKNSIKRKLRNLHSRWGSIGPVNRRFSAQKRLNFSRLIIIEKNKLQKRRSKLQCLERCWCL